MTRVLVLSDLWPPFPGGAERLAFNLARRLATRFDVRVVTGYEHARQLDGPPVEYADVPVHDRRAEGAAVLEDLVALVAPDVIVAHHLWAFQFERLLSDCGVPLVQLVLNGHRIAAAARAVFISDYVRRQTTSKWYDLTITPPAFDDVVAESHGDAVGFVKPLPHKGADLFWRLASRLPERRFVVLRGEWQDLEDVRYARNVDVMEPVVDIREFWSRVRLVVVPSLSEDAGTVGQEAAVNGVPCLSSNVGGLPETNAGGVLLPADDLRAWIRAVRSLDNPERYAAVVARQRAALERYDHRGRFDELADVIGDLS